MENRTNLKFTLEEVPEEIYGVKLSEATRQQISEGKESSLIEGMVIEGKELKNAKVRMIRNSEGEPELLFNYQREQLIIPEKIGDYVLTEEDKIKLRGGDIAGPAKIKGTEVYLQVDKELNSITVKSAKDISIKKIIELKQEKGIFEVAGYKPNDGEVKDLIEGKELPAKVFEQEGRFFSARISLTDDDRGIVFKDVTSLTPNQAKELRERLNVQRDENISSRVMGNVVNSGVDFVRDGERIVKEESTRAVIESGVGVMEQKSSLKSEEERLDVSGYQKEEGIYEKEYRKEKDVESVVEREYERKLSEGVEREPMKGEFVEVENNLLGDKALILIHGRITSGVDALEVKSGEEASRIVDRQRGYEKTGGEYVYELYKVERESLKSDVFLQKDPDSNYHNDMLHEHLRRNGELIIDFSEKKNEKGVSVDIPFVKNEEGRFELRSIDQDQWEELKKKENFSFNMDYRYYTDVLGKENVILNREGFKFAIENGVFPTPIGRVDYSSRESEEMERMNRSEKLNNKDLEFKDAFQRKDFAKLNDLVKEGYKPSEVLIKNLESLPGVTDNDRIALRTVTGIEPNKELKGEKNQDFSNEKGKQVQITGKEKSNEKGNEQKDSKVVERIVDKLAHDM